MSVKQDTLYLKIEKNILIQKSNVTLNDVAKMTCSDEAAIRQIKQIKIYSFHKKPNEKKKKEQIQTFSVLKVIELIQKDYPDIEVENIGESDFILIYKPWQESKPFMMIKSFVLCIVFFFGAAFSIMTFNKDVDVTKIFNQFYLQIMGKESSGFTILEISYSVGLAVGVLAFFNHIGKKKITHDPTPLQVQMRKYEQDVDTTFIENSSREGSNIDVN